MLSSVAAGAGVLLAGAVIAGVLLAGVAFAGAWWLRRRAARRLEAMGQAVAGRARQGAAGAASAGARWLWSRPLPDRRWISAGRARRQLWRAVSAAEHAVAAARDGGAPVGDLDALCGRLRQAAGDAGRSLAIAGRGTGGGRPDPGRRGRGAGLEVAACGEQPGGRRAPRRGSAGGRDGERRRPVRAPGSEGCEPAGGEVSRCPGG